MSKQCFNSTKAPAVLGPYSQAVVAGGFVFLSGQLGLDPKTNELVSGGVKAQARQALANAASVLAELELSMANVVKTTIFLRNLDDYPVVNGVYAESFGTDFPARSAIQVSGLPKDASVEIELVACIEDEE